MPHFHSRVSEKSFAFGAYAQRDLGGRERVGMPRKVVLPALVR
jgi:hypothetical protein